jgi:hypothetical protein
VVQEVRRLQKSTKEAGNVEWSGVAGAGVIDAKWDGCRQTREGHGLG